jgi:hypothetical protein
MKVTKIGDHISVTQGKYDTVFVTRPSLISNKFHTVSFGGVRYEDVVQYLEERYHRKPGLMVDEMFPQLNDAEREFLMTGITEEEWNTHMKEDEE